MGGAIGGGLETAGGAVWPSGTAFVVPVCVLKLGGGGLVGGWALACGCPG